MPFAFSARMAAARIAATGLLAIRDEDQDARPARVREVSRDLAQGRADGRVGRLHDLERGDAVGHGAGIQRRQRHRQRRRAGVAARAAGARASVAEDAQRDRGTGRQAPRDEVGEDLAGHVDLALSTRCRSSMLPDVSRMISVLTPLEVGPG